MITVKVLDFTEFPGPRYEKIGEFSGARFRDEVLIEAIKLHGPDNIAVDLDGTAGYGSSFLEEAFGGLVRSNVIKPEQALALCSRLTSEDDPSLIDEIKSYISDAVKAGDSA